MRLAELGFIVFERDADSGEFVVDLDFAAIGKHGSK